MIKTQVTRFIAPAPFYTGPQGGDSALGDLILTGFETPPFIPGDSPRSTRILVAQGVPPVENQAPVTAVAAQAAPEPESDLKKYLPYAIAGVALIGGGFMFYKMRKP